MPVFTCCTLRWLNTLTAVSFSFAVMYRPSPDRMSFPYASPYAESNHDYELVDYGYYLTPIRWPFVAPPPIRIRREDNRSQIACLLVFAFFCGATLGGLSAYSFTDAHFRSKWACKTTSIDFADPVHAERLQDALSDQELENMRTSYVDFWYKNLSKTIEFCEEGNRFTCIGSVRWDRLTPFTVRDRIRYPYIPQSKSRMPGKANNSLLP